MAPSSAKSTFEFSFRTRLSHWNDLKEHPEKIHDVVIMGGGIAGAGLLREFVLRNIKDVWLFEKGDFASATSGVSSKLIHAGIRYLEQAWIHLKRFAFLSALRSVHFVWAASLERKTLGRLAPHLVKPKPIYLVLGKDDSRSVLAVMIGVWLYYMIQLLQGQFFGPPRAVFRKKALRWIAPDLNHDNIKAIYSFWDSQTDDARLVIENLQSAARHGGKALNYIEGTRFRRTDDGFSVDLLNKETGQTIRVKTKILINATGPFIDEFRKKRDGQHDFSHLLLDRVAGMHMDLYPAQTRESYYLTAGPGRLVFVLQRDEEGYAYTRIGTTERSLSVQEPSDSPRPTPKEIDYLRHWVHQFFPHMDLSQKNILRMDAGIRPLRRDESDLLSLKSRDHDIIEEDGLYSIVGVKLTDYRRVAREVFSRVPWVRWDIVPSSWDRSGDVPLRECQTPDPYEERSAQEIVDQTMVLHWRDYWNRRRGLIPRILYREKRRELEKTFKTMAGVLGWSVDQQEKEKK